MRRLRLAGFGLALLAWLVPPCDGAPATGSDTDAEESLRLPYTMERVWYRSGKKRGFGGAQLSGDLTLAAEGLELVGRKRSLSIPWESISVVSFGKMRGDVNTDWVVLAVERVGEETLVGLRDGRKWGYGTRTREIYEVLKRAVKQVGAAQYDVPRGLEPYDELDHQFTMAIPAGWASSHLSIVEVDERPVWGSIVFSAEEIPGSREPERKQQALAAVESGDTAALLLDRREVVGGMHCSGFSKEARQTLSRWVADLDLVPGGPDWLLEGSLQVDPWPLTGCEGLRLVGRGKRSDGPSVVLDARAVSDDETVFLFVLRSVEEDYASRVRALERLLATFRFSVARRSPD